MSRPSFTNSPITFNRWPVGCRYCARSTANGPVPPCRKLPTQIGLSRAVARRSLLTLQHLGYVAAQGRQFFLTPRVLELGYSYLSSLDLTDLAHEPMEKLSQRVGESCSMAVLDGSEIVYVVRVAVRRLMSVALGVGARLPAFAASMGRVLLADKSDNELAAWLRGNTFRPITAHTIYKTRALQGGNPARCAAKATRSSRRSWSWDCARLRCRFVPLQDRRVWSQRQHALQRRCEGVGAEKNVADFASRATVDRSAMARDGWRPLTISRSP